MRVNQDVKFSYNLVKGSVKDRQHLVESLNEKFYNNIQPILKGGKCTVNQIRDTYCKILPEKKKIKVLSLCDKFGNGYDGASDYIYNNSNYITGVTLEIPAKRSKVSEKSLVALMHENTHVIATLANPKQTALTQKLYRNDQYTWQRNNWFDKFLYRDEKAKSESEKEKALSEVKKETEKFLSGKSLTEKIDHLQDARYELEQEKDAHSEQLKYAKRVQKAGMPVDDEDLVDCDRVYLFTEKIKLLKTMTFDLIAKQRKKFADQFNRFS